jgi:hypothetical protein
VEGEQQECVDCGCAIDIAIPYVKGSEPAPVYLCERCARTDAFASTIVELNTVLPCGLSGDKAGATCRRPTRHALVHPDSIVRGQWAMIPVCEDCLRRRMAFIEGLLSAIR